MYSTMRNSRDLLFILICLRIRVIYGYPLNKFLICIGGISKDYWKRDLLLDA